MAKDYKAVLQEAREALEWARRELPNFQALEAEIKYEIQTHRSLYWTRPLQTLQTAYDRVLARQAQENEIEDVIFD